MLFMPPRSSAFQAHQTPCPLAFWNLRSIKDSDGSCAHKKWLQVLDIAPRIKRRRPFYCHLWYCSSGLCPVNSERPEHVASEAQATGRRPEPRRVTCPRYPGGFYLWSTQSCEWLLACLLHTYFTESRSPRVGGPFRECWLRTHCGPNTVTSIFG